MKNPEVLLFLLVVLCGYAGLPSHLCVSAGETRKLTDVLQRSESAGQVYMSHASPGGQAGDSALSHGRPGSVSPGSAPQVRAGGVKALHLSLAGVGQVRAMWMNPVPFTKATDFRPQCEYTVLPSPEKRENGAPLAARNGRFEESSKPDRDGRGSLKTASVAGGRAYTYTAGNFKATLNEAVMTYEPGSLPVIVSYRCGDLNYIMGPTYNVTVHPATLRKGVTSETSANGSPGRTCAGGERVGRVALIADMGIEEDSFTVKSMLHQLDQGELDFVLHAGDVSYADNFGTTFGSGDGNNSWVWDGYMTSLQDVTARLPYMTCPGNHERQFDFAAYRNWLHMPANESGSSSPYYYSFDYLGVHFVGISTEHDLGPNSTQHRWLEQDLRTADQNRARTPWILVFGHRPLYCSSAILWTTRCTKEAEKYRSDFEALLQRYHVDVYVCGHNHQYERSWPVSQGNVTARSYHNPAATVHIVTGAAGSPEGNDPTYVPGFLAPWRAGYSETVLTGWTLMEVNSTALAFSYIHSADGRAVDNFTITKTTGKTLT